MRAFHLNKIYLPTWVDESSLENEINRLSNLPVVASGMLMLKNLPLFLYFHNFEHTLSVFEAITTLALVGKLAEEEREICAIAAIFHDLGFLEASSGQGELLYENENRGAQLAAAWMGRFSYSDGSIKAVKEMILDTALVPIWEGSIPEQEALRNKQSAYLLDADLNNLGTAGFFLSMLRVFNERFNDNVSSIEELAALDLGFKFMNDTLDFIVHHEWKTESAKILLSQKKQENIERLRREIEKVSN